jgi:beta-glucosidase
MTFRKALRWFLTIAALMVVTLITGLALYIWLSYPKLATDSVFVRPAGHDVFKFTDIPHGRELTPQEVNQYTDKLLSEMTLKEKVHQMSGDSWLWDSVRLLTVEKLKYNDRPIPAGNNRRLEIPPIMFSDGPRGVIMGHSTCFPVAMARGASWDVDLQRRVGNAIGQEIRAQGGNFYGGICINVLRHPAWGRAQETYGEDPYLLGEMGVALMQGVQHNNVMGCAKHYDMNSIELSRFNVNVNADERTLREVYLPQFKRLVDAGVASVMSSYNKVRGDSCGENAYLLRKVLKEEWGFQGFVMSDFYEGVHDGDKAAKAGLDVEMPSPIQFGKPFLAAVETGKVPRAVIEEAARRILRRKIKYLTRPDPMHYDASMIVSKEHTDLAREVAEESMVLLKNQGGVLPLDKSKLKTLAVIGRLANVADTGDHGSSRVYPPYVVTPLAGLEHYLGASANVTYEDGSNLALARQAAKKADAVVIVAGYDYQDEGEYIPQLPPPERGGDRTSLKLHPDEVELIQAVAPENPRTIVVLVGGSAIMMEEWKQKVNAILMAWYSGMEGGTALARILFGDVNPSGKLTVTIPSDPAQLPPFDPHADSVEYGYYHGYALADQKGYKPAFPFGYGLSYTTFKYSNLRLSAPQLAPDGALAVTVDVTNTGPRAGKEVVELYAGFPHARVDRPVKLLRGFTKAALAPGEKKTVAFTVHASDLAYYDPQAAAWRVEPVEHEILVGGSSRPADLLKATFRVTGAGEVREATAAMSSRLAPLKNH